MIACVGLQAVDPYIEVLNVVPHIAILKTYRLDRAFDLEAAQRPTAVPRGLRHREHSYWDDVDLQRRAGHQATAFLDARRADLRKSCSASFVLAKSRPSSRKALPSNMSALP